MTITNPSAASPVEIDTRLAEIYAAQHAARAETARAAETIYYLAKPRAERKWSERNKRPGFGVDEAIEKARANAESYEQRNVERAVEALTTARARLAELAEEAAPLHEQYAERRWTRAFLVVNNGGHVHSSMECSTCYRDRWDPVTGEFKPGTAFNWLPSYSGHSEAEIVADAGERACTVCYKSAPVDVLSRPTKIYSDAERDAQAAREEREQAKIARHAAKIAKGLTPDGSEFKVTYVEPNAPGWERDPVTGQSIHVYRDREHREFFKTERAAVQWVVQYAAWSGWDHYRAAGFAQVIEAVAAKHGKSVEEVRAELEAKVEAKIKRDNR